MCRTHDQIKNRKRGHRKVGEFRKKLMIPKSEISQCAEHMIKSKIGKEVIEK